MTSPSGTAAKGPTQKVIDQFGGIDSIQVDVGFDASKIMAAKNRLAMADLTPLYSKSTEPADSFSGRHSDK